MSLAEQFKMVTDGESYPVTEAVNEWNGVFHQDALDRVFEVMTKDMTQIDHRRDGSGRIRPSTIGLTCSRPALLSFLGDSRDPEPKSAREIMNSGTWRHYRWQAIGLTTGFLDDIEVPLHHPAWHLSGAADGIGQPVGVFEFKSVTTNIFTRVRKSLPKPAATQPHLEQTTAYQVATGQEWASIVYEDRQFLRFQEIRVRLDPKLVDVLETRFGIWNEHLNDDSLPPILHNCWKQTGKVYQNCSWKAACFARG